MWTVTKPTTGIPNRWWCVFVLLRREFFWHFGSGSCPCCLCCISSSFSWINPTRWRVRFMIRGLFGGCWCWLYRVRGRLPSVLAGFFGRGSPICLFCGVGLGGWSWSSCLYQLLFKVRTIVSWKVNLRVRFSDSWLQFELYYFYCSVEGCFLCTFFVYRYF